MANFDNIFNTFLWLGRFLDGTSVQREPDLHSLHDICNLFRINSEGTNQHIHMEMIADMSRILADDLEHIYLILIKFLDMLPMVQYLVCLEIGSSWLCSGYSKYFPEGIKMWTPGCKKWLIFVEMWRWQDMEQ